MMRVPVTTISSTLSTSCAAAAASDGPAAAEKETLLYRTGASAKADAKIVLTHRLTDRLEMPSAEETRLDISVFKINPHFEARFYGIFRIQARLTTQLTRPPNRQSNPLGGLMGTVKMSARKHELFLFCAVHEDIDRITVAPIGFAR
jgi:hypothetical protein